MPYDLSKPLVIGISSRALFNLEAFFLGGVSKTEVLAAFGAHIFFDDQDVHTEPASVVVPSATVPYRDGDNPKE